jgi:hypothetical protein
MAKISKVTAIFFKKRPLSKIRNHSIPHSRNYTIEICRAML